MIRRVRMANRGLRRPGGHGKFRPHTLLSILGSNCPRPRHCRFVLNYKRLRYRTQWVELPDVERTLRSIGAPPTTHRADGTPVYNLPVIVNHTHAGAPEVVVGAERIAEYLDMRYPACLVFPEGARAPQMLLVQWMMETWARPVLAVMGPLSFAGLGERSREWVGPLSAVRQRSAGTQEQWELVRQKFDSLARELDRGDGDGTVVMGQEVTYADFALCSVLVWIRNAAPYVVWEMVKTWNGGRWQRLWDRCSRYMDVV